MDRLSLWRNPVSSGISSREGGGRAYFFVAWCLCLKIHYFYLNFTQVPHLNPWDVTETEDAI